MQFARKSLVSLLDLWYASNCLPIEEWRTEYAHIQTQLESVNDKIHAFEKIMRELKNTSIQIPSESYTEYYRNKTIRTSLIRYMFILDEDENNRVWYHATRRSLIS